MRFVFILVLFVAPVANAQTRIFDLGKLEDKKFRDFIAGKKVVVIGEMHGTTEVPLFVLQLVRQLKQDQKRLTVGLEIPVDHQKDIDEFFKKGDFDKLLELDYFKYPDGRTSAAMGQLIKGLRETKGVLVICFDVASNAPQGVNRDSLMGVILSNSYKSGQMVMLTGNLHANLKEGYWRPKFRSAAFHFNRIEGFNEKLISLNTYFGSGTIWNCMQDGCKEREAFGNGSLKQKDGPANFLCVYESSPSNLHPTGYNGFLFFDKVTASRPLVN